MGGVRGEGDNIGMSHDTVSSIPTVVQIVIHMDHFQYDSLYL